MPHFITFANEKGGTGKSTTAVHSAVALAAQGRKVAALDLDTRQRTLGRYLDNRAATMQRQRARSADARLRDLRSRPRTRASRRRSSGSARDAEIVVIDTPGRDDPCSRAAMVRADTLVTPINDSFVDLDLIGEVDAETYRVRRPSFYAELVWNSRTQRAKDRRRQRRLGRAAEPHAAYRGAQHAPRRRGAGRAVAPGRLPHHPRASASASSTASSSPRA